MEEHCSACERLREENADFIEYGISDPECKSLQNDTGLNSKLTVLHDDCQDLNDMNDCLVAQHGQTIPAYDDCDWKVYATDQNWNLWNMFKGIICAICGLWKNIHDIWKKVDDLDKEMFKLIACKEEGSGIFTGTVFSGSYMIDNKNSNRTLTTYQLRVQILPTSSFTIPHGGMYAIPFKNKGLNDKKLECIDIIMEHVEKVQWHNADLKAESDAPEVFNELESYIFSPGKNVAGREFSGNIYIYAKDRAITFSAGVPVQTAITWAMEPIN